MLRCEDDDELLRELLRSIDTTAVDCCCADVLLVLKLSLELSTCENLKIVVTRRAEDAAAQNGRKAKTTESTAPPTRTTARQPQDLVRQLPHLRNLHGHHH